MSFKSKVCYSTVYRISRLHKSNTFCAHIVFQPEENIEENNVYVVFKLNLHGSARKEGGVEGGEGGVTPP
jgi:hypothetical protein